jgi:hypothetical protein
MRDAEGEDTTEHLAGIEDLQFAKATYLAACRRWPGHQSPCAKARKSLKTIGYGLCKEHSGDYERPGRTRIMVFGATVAAMTAPRVTPSKTVP